MHPVREHGPFLSPAEWIPELLDRAGIQAPIESVSQVRWSYEYEDGETKRIADIVLCGRDAAGEFLIVIEAKRPGARLEEEPAYYLDLPPFQTYERRWLIYLLGRGEIEDARRRVPSADGRHGFITWEQLAALQISLARGLNVDPKLGNFIAGAIQYQFCQHGLRPASLAFPYLVRELAFENMPISEKEGGQSTLERREPLWRCDWGE